MNHQEIITTLNITLPINEVEITEQTISRHTILFLKEQTISRNILVLLGITAPHLFIHIYNIDDYFFNVNISSIPSYIFDITIKFKYTDNTYKIIQNRNSNILINKNYNRQSLKDTLEEFTITAYERERTQIEQ